MPFTPSHMAAALPFVRTPLLPAAVAIGSMAPDVPYFVPLGVPRWLSHSLLGVPTVDLAITLALVLLWYAVLRSPVIDLSPRPIRERMRWLSPLGWRRPGRGWPLSVLIVICSALAGILTHLAWDSFTHDGWLTEVWPALATQLGPLPLYKWLQHLSTVGGLAILAVWGARWIRRIPPVSQDVVATPRARVVAWVVVVLTFGIAGFIPWMHGILLGVPPFDPSLVFLGATVAGGVAGLVAFVICGLWWIVRARRQ